MPACVCNRSVQSEVQLMLLESEHQTGSATLSALRMCVKVSYH